MLTPIDSLDALLEQLKANDLIVIDIDETILFPGHDKYRDQPEFLLETVQALHALQTQQVPIVFLTARHGSHPQIQSKTFEQLTTLGLDPEKTAPKVSDTLNLDHNDHLYSQGILYAPRVNNQSQKGQALKTYLSQLSEKPDRLVFVDDTQQQLASVYKALTESSAFSIDVKLYHYRPYQALLRGFPDNNDAMPDDLSRLSYVKYLGGGGGGVYILQDDNTLRWYTLKAGVSTEQIKDEITADAIYRVLGLNVPDFSVFRVLPEKLACELGLPRKGIYRVSQYIEPDFSHRDDDIIKKELASGFVADAFIGNYDLATKHVYNNIIFDQTGCLYRIDNGNSIRFHARGRINQTSTVVDEIDHLKQFYDVDVETIRAQVRHLLDRVNSIANALYRLNAALDIEKGDELIQLYLDRAVYLRHRFCPHYLLAARYHPAEPKYTAAGTFIYRREPDSGEQYVLLGRRSRHQWWGNPGGKSDHTDEDLAETAVRETYEESLGLIDLDVDSVRQSHYWDRVTHNWQGEPYVYRMYAVELDDIDIDRLHERLAISTEPAEQEFSAFTEVPLTHLKASLKLPVTATMEGQPVAYIPIEGDKPLALHPPLYALLSNERVQKDIERLSQGKPRLPGAYKQLLTPGLIRQQTVAQALNRAEVMAELKSRIQPGYSPYGQTIGLDCCSGRQSDIHLRTILNGAYEPNDIKANVERFLDQSLLVLQCQGLDRATAVSRFVSMLANEKNAYSRRQILLYHAAQDQVAFLYDVFTGLRKFLSFMPDVYSRAFRAFDDFSRQYNGISEFMAAYSDAVTGEIDNYKPHYHEQALSCNFFLFGNHETPTSASFFRFLQNESRVPPDTYKLLRYVLANLGAPVELADEFYQLYHCYLSDKGARMYQIFIDNGIIDELVYPAGFLGSFNPMAEAGQYLTRPLAILGQLARSQQSQAQYIQYLQARLFLQPELMHDSACVQVREYSFYPISHAYYRQLNEIVRRAVQKSLLFHTDISRHLLQRPLHYQTAQVLRSQGLQAEPYNTGIYLVRAIQAGEAEKVSTLLDELSENDLANLPNPFYMDRENQDKTISAVSLIRICSLHNDSSKLILLPFFKQNCFVKLAKAVDPKTQVKTLNDFIFWVSLLQQEQLREYVFDKVCDRFCLLINSLEELAEAVNGISEPSRVNRLLVTLQERLPSMVNNTLGYVSLIQSVHKTSILAVLVDALACQFQHLLTSTKDLLMIHQALKSDKNRANLLEIAKCRLWNETDKDYSLPDFLLNYPRLNVSLSQLLTEYAYQAEGLVRVLHDGYGLALLLRCVNEASQHEVVNAVDGQFRQMAEIIGSGDELLQVLGALASKNQAKQILYSLFIVNSYIDRDAFDIDALLALLRLNIINHQQIEQTLLKVFDSPLKSLVVRDNNIHDLLASIRFLPNRELIETYLKQHQIVADVKDLHVILDYVRDASDKQQVLNNYSCVFPAIVSSADELTYLLRVFEQTSQKASILKSLGDRLGSIIQTDDGLSDVLGQLTDNAQIMFVLKSVNLIAMINSGLQLYALLGSLGSRHGQAYVLKTLENKLPQILQNTATIKFITNHLDSANQNKLFTFCLNHLNFEFESANELIDLLIAFHSPRQRAIILKRSQSLLPALLQSAYQLGQLFAKLESEDDKRSVLKAYSRHRLSALFTTPVELAYVLNRVYDQDNKKRVVACVESQLLHSITLTTAVDQQLKEYTVKKGIPRQDITVRINQTIHWVEQLKFDHSERISDRLYDRISRVQLLCLVDNYHALRPKPGMTTISQSRVADDLQRLYNMLAMIRLEVNSQPTTLGQSLDMVDYRFFRQRRSIKALDDSFDDVLESLGQIIRDYHHLTVLTDQYRLAKNNEQLRCDHG